MNNLVVVIAFCIAAGWAWGSVEVVQKNINLQRQVDDKQRQMKLVQLETDNLAYEQKYYQSIEYKELAARERFGLARPGEKVLVLPPNTPEAKAFDQKANTTVELQETVQPSNFQQWMNFLFGGNHQANG